MDALEQLIQYRDVDPVDDRLVAQVVDTITRAAHDGQRHHRHHPSAPRRHRNGRRLAVVSGAVIAAMAAGGGLAAAAGLFQSHPTPLPASLSFLSGSDPSKAPGATVQTSIAGPGGTIFRVVTDTLTTNNQADTCVALAIESPSGQPIPHRPPGMCELNQSPPGQPVPTLRLVTPGVGMSQWRSPSGATFYVIFGQGIPGLARVALTDTNGNPATSEPATPGGYVIYVPAADFTAHSRIVFSDASGKVLFAQELNVTPGRRVG